MGQGAEHGCGKRKIIRDRHCQVRQMVGEYDICRPLLGDWKLAFKADRKDFRHAFEVVADLDDC
jgi:hypothetical protein